MRKWDDVDWVLATVIVAAAAGGLSIAIIDGADVLVSKQYIGGAKLVTDPVNGCQYLVDRGITPRLRPDGKQICLGRQQ